MDPNANLAEQRSIVQRIHAIEDACDADGHYTYAQTDDLAAHAMRLAELVEALDVWLTRGGIRPLAWALKHHG